MKNIFTTTKLLVLFTFLLISNLYAVNELSVLNSSVNGSKPGFIDKAVLVVEPNGGYIQQSLYLDYSDHNQYYEGDQLEVVHRFELPRNSVINDMWLWIGDSIMQAIIMDTWTATAIYDSIVSFKRDPALLKKMGDQYELHVYPLTPGSVRKVKINFITPARWIGTEAVAELPYKMLMANNSNVKPIQILFKQKENEWGDAFLTEYPDGEFVNLTDTLGYNYKVLEVADITPLESMKLSYLMKFNGGKYFSGYTNKSDTSYFQLGFSPGKLFNLSTDNSEKKKLFGIDLSGLYNKNLSYLIPNLTKVINGSLKEGDSYKIYIAGAGSVYSLTDEWISYSENSVTHVLNEFQYSALADSILKNEKKNVIFCDYDAAAGWKFTGIEQYANVMQFNNIMSAAPHFKEANVIAAYRHGYDDPINQQELYQLLAPLDSFFVKGGRLLSYYDLNRIGVELLASHFIPGLTRKGYSRDAITLYRNPEGNIGNDFPEHIDHNWVWGIDYDDPEVKNELISADGYPAVVSKKIKNGLLVVSAIWQIKDDNAMKSILGPPLLGLNSVSKNLQLENLLHTAKMEYNNDQYDQLIIFSNADSLYYENDAAIFTNNYISGFTSPPVVNTVNLLNSVNISIPSITVDNKTYYGSGYLLNKLSEETGGLHFETNDTDWDIIASTLSSSSYPKMESFDISATVDDGSGILNKLRETGRNRNDPNKPLFFIGEADGDSKIKFDITATFADDPEVYNSSEEYFFEHDSAEFETVIPSLVAYEELNDLFLENPIDTTVIVNLAIDYNLLCDYTALIALEPNDTIHFLHHPLDEGGMTAVTEEKKTAKDSSFIEIYPNPFNNQTNLKITLSENSKVSVYIYNILGQKVAELINCQILSGKKEYYWNGKNMNGQSVGSGIYILVADINGLVSGKNKLITKKIMYLK